jgi:hypothetical protein
MQHACTSHSSPGMAKRSRIWCRRYPARPRQRQASAASNAAKRRKRRKRRTGINEEDERERDVQQVDEVPLDHAPVVLLGGHHVRRVDVRGRDAAHWSDRHRRRPAIDCAARGASACMHSPCKRTAHASARTAHASARRCSECMMRGALRCASALAAKRPVKNWAPYRQPSTIKTCLIKDSPNALRMFWLRWDGRCVMRERVCAELAQRMQHACTACTALCSPCAVPAQRLGAGAEPGAAQRASNSPPEARPRRQRQPAGVRSAAHPKAMKGTHTVRQQEPKSLAEQSPGSSGWRTRRC